MAIRFMDLKKAFDTVPRGVVMATVRWVGMPEAEARIVERMYERAMGRVLIGMDWHGLALIGMDWRIMFNICLIYV